MMDCACSMDAGWMMLFPALILAALVMGGIVLVRRLRREAPRTVAARHFASSRSASREVRSIAMSSMRSASILGCDAS